MAMFMAYLTVLVIFFLYLSVFDKKKTINSLMAGFCIAAVWPIAMFFMIRYALREVQGE